MWHKSSAIVKMHRELRVLPRFHGSISGRLIAITLICATKLTQSCSS